MRRLDSAAEAHASARMGPQGAEVDKKEVEAHWDT
jgi:hypothetical protein